MDNFKLSFVHIIDDVVVFDCSLSFSKINRKLTEKETVFVSERGVYCSSCVSTKRRRKSVLIVAVTREGCPCGCTNSK